MTKKAKTNPLLVSLDDEPVRSRGITWAEKMQRDDPQRYRWILELCMDFHSGGEAFRKLQNLSGVFEYLKKHKMLLQIGRSAFRDWFAKLKA